LTFFKAECGIHVCIVCEGRK